MFFKDERTNTIILSIIWGLGIAALFRKVCDDNKCIVVKAPKDMNSYQQEKNKSCYKFVKHGTECFKNI
jgi:hypothetical protein